MELSKIQSVVSHIDFLISELKVLKNKISIEDGIHFRILRESGYSAIETLDSEMDSPRIFLNTKTDIEEKEFVIRIQEALNTLGPRAFKKQIYWNSDFPWESLSENFNKLDKIFNIEKRSLSAELREEIKERINDICSNGEQ